MARKTKRDDLAAKPETLKDPIDTNRQPRIFGWLVLIVGSFSTWYWYRPLPSSVQETVHSVLPNHWAISQTGPKSLWTAEGLFVPSISPDEPEGVGGQLDSLGEKGEDSGLVKSPAVTLMPLNETRLDIRDVIQTESIPRMPLEPSASSRLKPMDGPTIWTPDSQKPDRVSSKLNSDPKWPDEGFMSKRSQKKAQQKATTKITTQIPPLLETGMRSIRSFDEKESQNNTDARNAESVQPSIAPDLPKRPPQFINQPGGK